ncbi:MAG: Cyanophycin synthase(EC [uncultured Thermomicrobiales bacterium]|uniref:Cyanophycin synthetase n=1 Tax=uncultured Thermomicrobiales bacterium TaxID=1645740 RepID=A0A6J4TUZ7_9BACT|nr:MAG: Cyanophycin synthase(EC [uncultured Thermomicrobiales bacterium]
MLTIRSTNVLRGPNVWARVPVIHYVVDLGEFEERPSNKIPGFYEHLTELLPSLYEHACSVGRPGGFLQRLREGTWLGHVMEHVALELQNLAGAEVRRGVTRSTGEHGVYNVVFQYEQEDVGLAAGALSLRLLNHLAAGAEPGFDFVRAVEEEVIRVAERLAYGPSTGAIVSEAVRRGIPVLRLDPRRSLVQLGHGKHQKRVWATVTSASANIAVDIASNKELTNRLLDDVGIPVPRGTVVRTADEAVRASGRIGYPVVLKPLDGNHGRGVCINLADEATVREFFPVALAESRAGTVVVERFISGKDYRILVVNNEVVAVAERVPAHVVGDGVHTIETLVERANADPRRGVGHEKILTRITVDEQTLEVLERQGLTTAHVPEDGRIVQLKLTGNMSTGGTSIDRTDDIHPDNVEIARQAAMVVGLDIAGIDFITEDIARSVRHSGGAICEVNAGPGFRMHTHPTEGHPRHVGRAVVDMLFPHGTGSRVPIVAVTGTNGKTTTSRMIAHVMKTAGRKVGLTTTDGIYIDGTLIRSGDTSGPTSAQMVLKNPAVDFAVLETARGGILRSGLGFDRCDIAVVTNVASDHLGLRGVDTLADLARVKAVVPQAVLRDGASVLNADNEWTVEMARKARGEIVFFSLDEENPVIRDHVRDRGKAVVLRQTRQGEMITLIEHKRDTSLLLANQIPATFEGKIRVNVANALAAAAAAFAADVQLEHIRHALRTFASDFFQTPGRFNLLSLNGRQVLIDYCHNVAGLEAMADFVRRMDAPKTVAMISMPGDRSDADMAAFGALAGRTFDRIVIREDDNTRGRPRGDIAARLREAVVGSGAGDEKVSVVLDELEASSATVDLADKDDLVVLMVDHPMAVYERLTGRGGGNGLAG